MKDDNVCEGCKYDETTTIDTILRFCNYCKRASDDELHQRLHQDFFEPLEEVKKDG